MSEEKKKVLTMIEACEACVTTKFIDGKCTAYLPTHQERLFKVGWCSLGSSGNKPPADHIGKDSTKKRVGQQKQKK